MANTYVLDINVVLELMRPNADARVERPSQVQDAMIAACCMAHVATLVTRNSKDFEGLDLALINPWD